MSRVVVVKYSGNADNKFLDKNQYRRLLETAFSGLAGGADFGTYLIERFPKGTVGMKTNCLAAYNPTLSPLIDALSELITQSTDIDDNHLIIWERTNRELKQAGFKLNASSFGRRYLGTDTSGVGYDDSRFYSAGKVSSMVSSILTGMVDHSINLGVLKHHSIAGMSAGMKNMYGAIHNPNKYHGNNCSPFAADINNLEPIRGKHRLTVVDAVRVQYDKGPGFSPKYMEYYNGLILSEDPVAADSVALMVLDHLRTRNGLPPLATTNQHVKYLEAGEEIGLGIANINKIDLKVAVVAADGSISTGDLF